MLAQRWAPALSVKQKCFNLGKLFFWIAFPASLAASLSAWLPSLKQGSVVWFLFLQGRGRGASACCQGGDLTPVMLSRCEGTKLFAIYMFSGKKSNGTMFLCCPSFQVK